MNTRLSIAVVVMAGVVAALWINDPRADAGADDLATRVADLEWRVDNQEAAILSLPGAAISSGGAIYFVPDGGSDSRPNDGGFVAGSGGYDIACAGFLGASIGDVELEIQVGLFDEPDRLTGAHLTSISATECTIEATQQVAP